ncbi:MAG TPA: hypothetical protein VN709_10825 [Terriglobales bacterium]|nr:hypothetical protein [Terriglobales bacterium]
MNRERLWLLALSLLLLAQLVVPPTIARACEPSTALDNHGLVLRLSLDTAPTEPALTPDYPDFPRASQSECLENNPTLACTPMVLVLENHGARALRSGLMNCSPRPISFQLHGEDGIWRELARNEFGNCNRNFMVWHTIPPGGSYVVHLRLVDSYGLKKSSIENRTRLIVRLGWSVFGCPAAENPHSESAPLPEGTDPFLWKAQCAEGTKPQTGYAQLVSNPVILEVQP